MAFKTELANTKDSLNMNFKILTAFGMWTKEQYVGTRNEILYWIFSTLFLGFWYYLYILTELINLWMVLGDLEAMVNAIFVMLTHLAQLYKTLVIMLRRDRIQKLLNTLDEPLFNEVDADVLPTIRDNMNIIRRSTIILISLSSCTVVLWAIFPFLESEDVRLPLTAWYPFDNECSANFRMVFAYQIVATLINAWNDCTLDTLISGTMALACIQLDSLKEKLRDKKRRFVPLSNREPGVTLEDHLVKNEEIRKHLTNCVYHHLAVLRFVEEVERLFGYSFLMQFVATTFIICVSAFKLTTLPMSIEMLSIMTYMSCVVMELLLFCFYGNEIIFKSREITQAAYESSWYEQTLENRKLIFILMERSKRPLNVAAMIFELSLSTFMAVIRSSYSYFAMLKNINNT